MKRTALQQLQLWKTATGRKPLILRGARQVGKSWLVRQFGNEFENFVEINFEKQPEIKELFSGSLDPKLLCEQLAIISQKTIVAGATLLFFDEIQECPRAITALRYFKEDYPELHVIAAGSLIDFALEEIGMPVGRVEFLYLYPLSFTEFLLAQDRQDLVDYIQKQEIAAPIHQLLLEMVKTFFWLGGMPAVIDTWLTTKDADKCRARQDEIINAYKQDFAKYAKLSQLSHIESVFNAIPQQLGKKFKYSNVDPDVRSENLKQALSALCKAGIAYKVNHSAVQGSPLAATQKSSHFKTFFFDIGLAQRILGLELNKWLLEKLAVQHIDAVAEQFVAQEYIAYTAMTTPASLFYWHREARTSNAEIDFIFVKQHDIVPIEVKSGTTGTLKSLLLFLNEHPKSTYGLRICEYNFTDDPATNIQTVPFYAIGAWLQHE